MSPVQVFKTLHQVKTNKQQNSNAFEAKAKILLSTWKFYVLSTNFVYLLHPSLYLFIL